MQQPPIAAAELVAGMARRARAAAQVLAAAPTARKRAALLGAAQALSAREEAVLGANAADMEEAQARGLGLAMRDRLRLDRARLAGCREALHAIADQPDPVGAVLAQWSRPNGLAIRKVRTPIGVIGVIYESRPNVTLDAGALSLWSGNAVILRGGSESARSSAALHACLLEGLREAGLPEDAVQAPPTRDRAVVSAMLQAGGLIDVIIPRGGKELVGLVQREARVPVFAHLEGVCHVYLDRAADPAKALAVTLNAKARRPGVCGAAECLLIDRPIADTVGRVVVQALLDAGVELRGDAASQALDARVRPAAEDDYGREFLDMIMAVRVVDDLGQAIAHIRRYGSSHTEAILTEDAAAVARFFAELDSAILLHNASTQFADGGEFGMGAEIGIATGKLHARGPVGAMELTSFKYLVEGNGAVRA